MTKQFNTTKEELQKLGEGFSTGAFTLIDDLFNLAYWLVLKKSGAKKVVWITYKKAIYYCDKTKADTDWNTWMHRIFFNRIFDYYSENPGADEFDFELIDHWHPDEDVIAGLPSNMNEKKLIKLLKNIPQILLLPLILKEVYNLQYKTIAEFLDVPDGVISTRIYRARKLIYITLLSRNFTESNSESKNSDLIFTLRVTSEHLDNEPADNEKKSAEEKIKKEPQLETEYKIQGLIKKLLNSSFTKRSPSSGLKKKIKKRAERRFFVKI